jgi:hypothetical protein
MSPQIEFTGQEPKTVPMAPVGSPVNLKIDSCELGETSEQAKNPGQPMYKVVLTVQAPGELYDGDRIYVNFVNPAGDLRQKIQFGQLFSAAGMPPTGALDTEQLIGKVVKAILRAKPASGDFPESRAVKSYISL